MRGLFVFSLLMGIAIIALVLVQTFEDTMAQATIVVVALVLEAIIWYTLGTSWAMEGPKNRAIRPTGQGGYQPHSDSPVDPMKLTPPTGGSSVQSPRRHQ